MIEQRQILERYLKSKFSDKKALSITHLDKLHDGWETPCMVFVKIFLKL